MKKIYSFLLLCFCALGASAQLAYNTTMTQNDFNNSKTVIEKQATDNRVDWSNNGIRLGYVSGLFGVQLPGDWADKYVVIALNQQSIPNQLKFKYKVDFAISSNPNWRVEESADNSTWSTIWSNESRNTSWSDQQVLTLSKSTKYIKLAFTGNYSGTFADIIVSDQSYVHNPKQGDNVISSLNFGSGTISSGTAELSFDVEWCNVNALSVTCNNTDFFSVSPASFGGKAKYGTATVTVGYNRDKEVGTHSGTITISNGSVTKTVSLSGETTKRNQSITWNADLVATGYTLNAEDVLTGAAVATADNEEAEITFASDNTDVIAVSEDGKTLYAIDNGTATITVTATDNDVYYEGTDSHLFTVTADKKQTIVWDQNFMSLKTNANPKTIALTATATSGGAVTYALEAGSDKCVTLSGENNSVMTITGTPGVAYIIATQAGGEINGEVWIEASARKQIKVRDPNSSCDEYALADQSFTFSKGDKTTMSEQEYTLIGKPTELTFTAKWGGLKFTWSEQQDMYVDQYANFGSGLEWRQITAFKVSKNNTSYGPIALDETATKIRFRSGEYGEQNVSNISVPRKKELVVSETTITETAERNVKWSKTISVSRSNIDVVDVSVVSNDPNCAFAVSKNSIGTDCADRSTETFEVSITPREKDSVYTGTITITDGKAVPTTRTVSLQIKTVGFNQSINDFELPNKALTTDTITFHATATSELEVRYISSDSTIAYVEDTVLVILCSGNVAITAYQAGDDRYNEASITKSIELSKTPTEVLEAPTASEMAQGDTLGISVLRGGEASVAGRFVWENESEVMDEMGSEERTVIFIPDNEGLYARSTTTTTVEVVGEAEPVILVMPTASELTYGEGLSQSELTGGVANVDGAFTWFDPDLTLTVGSNSVDVLFTPADEEHYSSVLLTVEVKVNKIATLEETVELSFCEGGSEMFHGKVYDAAVTEDVFAEGETRDTIYHVNVTVLQPTFGAEEMTITYGDDVVWNGIALGDSTVGTHSVVYVTENAAGCDSTVTLTLTVNKLETLNVPVELSFCEGGSETFHGKVYDATVTEDVFAEGATRDTVYHVTVTVHTPDFTELFALETVGEYFVLPEGIWYLRDGEEVVTEWTVTKADTAGLWFMEYLTNANGCDSITKYSIDVNLLAPVETEPVVLGFCPGDSVEYRGKWYAYYELDTIYVEDAVRDTIIYVEAIMLPTPDIMVLFDTIVSGNDVILPEGEWVIGEETVSGTYPTVESDEASVLVFRQYDVTFVGCGEAYIELEVTVNPKEKQPDDPTAIETVETADQAVKYFRKGVLYIRRGERLYTTDGRLME